MKLYLVKDLCDDEYYDLAYILHMISCFSLPIYVSVCYVFAILHPGAAGNIGCSNTTKFSCMTPCTILSLSPPRPAAREGIGNRLLSGSNIVGWVVVTSLLLVW